MTFENLTASDNGGRPRNSASIWRPGRSCTIKNQTTLNLPLAMWPAGTAPSLVRLGTRSLYALNSVDLVALRPLPLFRQQPRHVTAHGRQRRANPRPTRRARSYSWGRHQLRGSQVFLQFHSSTLLQIMDSLSFQETTAASNGTRTTTETTLPASAELSFLVPTPA